jgi:hypothetical protein
MPDPADILCRMGAVDTAMENTAHKDAVSTYDRALATNPECTAPKRLMM